MPTPHEQHDQARRLALAHAKAAARAKIANAEAKATAEAYSLAVANWQDPARLELARDLLSASQIAETTPTGQLAELAAERLTLAQLADELAQPRGYGPAPDLSLAREQTEALRQAGLGRTVEQRQQPDPDADPF